nr:hypothetical protein Iba_chr02aCG15840 [Ipomoea batatas]
MLQQAEGWRLPLLISKNTAMSWKTDCYPDLMQHHKGGSCLRWQNVLKFCQSLTGVPALCNTMWVYVPCLM